LIESFTLDLAGAFLVGLFNGESSIFSTVNFLAGLLALLFGESFSSSISYKLGT
jgi:hypothetical protein